jgi:tetratricopeptide (TPR) repeat protein
MTVLVEDDDGGSAYGSLIEDWQPSQSANYPLLVGTYRDQFGSNRMYGMMIRKHCSADIYEHDDFPIPEIEINIGSFKARHSLCDEDWIPIQLQAGISYLIETINLENTDTLLELYQASGALILRNDNRGQMQGMVGDDRSSAIQFTPMQSGKYWIKISQAQQIYGGNQIYEIKVSSEEVCDLQDNDVDGIVDEGIEICLACLSDQAEPDQSIAQASPIEIGKIYARNHCYDSEDYSQFLIDDLSLRFDFETYPYDPLTNTLLEVYDLNGRTLASDLETSDPKSLIQNLGFDSSGLHYMRVAETDDRSGEHLNYGVLVRNHCEDDLYEHDDWASIAKLREGEDWSEIRSLCDEDWIALNLRGQNRYIIESADLQNVDTYFELYQFLDQAPFVSNDDGGEGYASKIIVYAPTDVQLYLRVKTYSDTYGGINQYRLIFGLVPMEICDGRDNDIDGMTDEQLLNACGTCGDIPTEICDEIDNDCDGLTDENVSNRCGKCGPEPQEVCDGRDNDCDGLSDEMILNACGRCGPTPSERCDGMDNDCDLKTDEGCPGYDMFQAQIDMGDIDQNLQTTDLEILDADQEIDQFKSSAPDYRIIDSKPKIDLAIMESPESGHLGGGCSQGKAFSKANVQTNLSYAHLLMLLAIFGCLKLMRMKNALIFLAILPSLRHVQAQPLSDVIAECADCHPDQVKGFLETGMGKALYQPKDAKIIEDFSTQKATITHPQTKAIYKASIDENGKWWQIESTQDGTYERKVEVKYIVGSGNHTRSYIGEINGELVELPLTWYVEKKIWDMSPGYEGKKHFRFERPIKPECIFCHNDLSKIKAFSYAEYEAPFKEGISCQRCHGDASLHLKSQNGQKIEDQEIHAFLKKIQREDLLESKNTESKNTESKNTNQSPKQNLSEKVQTFGLSVLNLADLIRGISTDIPSKNHDQLQILKSSALGENLILNPKHLSTQRAYEICQQCHLTGNARVLYPGYTWDHYDPNLPLHEYMAIYMPDRKSVYAQNDSVFGISSHAERLQLSACFQKSPNQDLSCSKCHHPHQKNTREDQKTACLSCHQMEDCDAKHQIKADQICSDCHMNKGNTSDIPHVNFTDHWIRKIPTQTPAFKLDYAPLVNALPTPKDASQTLALAMSGIASVEYARLQSKNHGDWLDAKARLEEAEKSIDSKSLQVYSAVKLGLARVNLAFEEINAALFYYDAYLRLEPNDSIARLEYADLLMKAGKIEESKEAYLTVIEKSPQTYSAYNGLANLYQMQKNWTQAEHYYQLAHQKAPHVAEIAFNHAYLMMHQAKFTEAEKWLKEGIRRDGLKGEGYFHLGVLAIKQNQKETGLAWFEKGLSIDDSLKDVYWVRGRIYTFEKKWTLAQKDFEKLLSIDPKHVGGYLDYSRVFVEQKKKQEAIFLLERGFLQTNAKDLWDAIEFIKQMKD